MPKIPVGESPRATDPVVEAQALLAGFQPELAKLKAEHDRLERETREAGERLGEGLTQLRQELDRLLIGVRFSYTGEVENFKNLVRGGPSRPTVEVLTGEEVEVVGVNVFSVSGNLVSRIFVKQVGGDQKDALGMTWNDFVDSYPSGVIESQPVGTLGT